jgi:DNA-binding winged helix-turn-helix (wHTH) protein/tetratricopeptide (TPR) repeat protein
MRFAGDLRQYWHDLGGAARLTTCGRVGSSVDAGDRGGTPPGSGGSLVFSPFSLDPVGQRLWRDGRPVQLKPKAFAVLWYLLERANRLVTKQELLGEVWGGVHVGGAVLKTQLRDIRHALGDEAKTPRYIETSHRRGYRFIAPVRKVKAHSPVQGATVSHFVGRQSESLILEGELARVFTGCRRAVFVTGQPGIGKTSLVRAFCDRLELEGTVLVAWGQCVEQGGAGEAYLPLLEAIGRIGRGPGRDALLAALHQYAPSWLPHLPSLGQAETASASPASRLAAPLGRMLREMAEALEAMSLDRPVLLLLEDLHWADPSTLAWLDYVARRADPARLLVIATARSASIASPEHPLAALKRELDLVPCCTELTVSFFSRQDLEEHLSARFGPRGSDPSLADVVFELTGGNPLFVVKLVDAWLQQGLIRREVGGAWRLSSVAAARGAPTPRSILALIEKETECLSAVELNILQAASAAGFEFSTAAVAAAVDEDLVRVEDICLGWVRRSQFIRSTGKVQWPDGTLGTRCEFIHILYQQSIYECIGPTRQARLRLALAKRLEAAFGKDALEAPGVGAPLAMTRGDAAAEVEGTYARARQPCRELGKAPRPASLLPDIISFYVVRGAYRTARDLAAQSLSLEEQQPTAGEQTVIETSVLLGIAQVSMGKLREAHLRFEQAMQRYDPDRHRFSRVLHEQDTGVVTRAFAGVALCLLGYPDQGLQLEREALALGERRADPSAMALASTNLTLVLTLRCDFEDADRAAAAGIELCAQLGLSYYLAMLQLLRATSNIEEPDRRASHRHVQDAWHALCARGSDSGGARVRCLLARSYARINRRADAFAMLREAFACAERDGEHLWESEIYRALGEVLLQVGRVPEELASSERLPNDPALAAEACFARALALSRSIQAKLLELRAARSLASLWRDQGKVSQAHELLSGTHGSFVEGFACGALRDAERLSNELAEQRRRGGVVVRARHARG